MTGHRPHHAGTFGRRAMATRARAWRDPSTRCRRCHRTIDQIRHANGTPAHWTAGHLVDGQVDGDLAPECSVCAARSGAQRGNAIRNARRNPTTRRWT